MLTSTLIRELDIISPFWRDLYENVGEAAEALLLSRKVPEEPQVSTEESQPV
jgi:hypothetical protein